ncbi:MAG: hypothetical protein V2A73_18085, partial [Pseudomonadota bacterium]
MQRYRHAREWTKRHALLGLLVATATTACDAGGGCSNTADVEKLTAHTSVCNKNRVCEPGESC